MPSLTVALLLLEWLHDGVYAGRCYVRARTLTLVLTTGLITIFILVISVIGSVRLLVLCVYARDYHP